MTLPLFPLDAAKHRPGQWPPLVDGQDVGGLTISLHNKAAPPSPQKINFEQGLSLLDNWHKLFSSGIYLPTDIGGQGSPFPFFLK